MQSKDEVPNTRRYAILKNLENIFSLGDYVIPVDAYRQDQTPCIVVDFTVLDQVWYPDDGLVIITPVNNAKKQMAFVPRHLGYLNQDDIDAYFSNCKV